MNRSKRPAKRKWRCCDEVTSDYGNTDAVTPQTPQAEHSSSKRACSHPKAATCTSTCSQPATHSQTTVPSVQLPTDHNLLTNGAQMSDNHHDPAHSDTDHNHQLHQLPVNSNQPPNLQHQNVFLSDSSSDSDSADEDLSFQGMLQQHSNSLLANGMTYQEPISTPISTQVSKKVKKMIWSNKFLDLAILLPNSSIESNSYTLQLDSQSNIAIVPTKKTRKILSVDMWTSAFLRFTAIYSARFPLETPALMKYAKIVRDLAAKRPGLAFLQYDSQFPKLRESVMVPWDRIHTEFWLLSSTLPMTLSQAQGRPFRGPTPFRRPHPQRPTRFLDNTCWVYNRRGECRNLNCSHPHVCGLCRSNHPATRCTGKQKQPIQTSSTLPIARPTGPRPTGK